jgi:hypothetical protein
MMKHPAKFCEKEGVKVGEAAAGGVTATAVCTGAAKVFGPCLKSAPEAVVEGAPEAEVAIPVAEVVLVDGAGEL